MGGGDYCSFKWFSKLHARQLHAPWRMVLMFLMQLGEIVFGRRGQRSLWNAGICSSYRIYCRTDGGQDPGIF